MTPREHASSPRLPIAAPGSAWERCDHCQAPLDERQRYCVACGARRPQADDPAARWFAVATRRARASAATPRPTAPSRPASGLRTAIVFALLPLAAAIGVMVGRGGTSGDERLLEALKAQKAPVVNVSGSGGAAGAADAAADRKAKRSNDADDGADAADGKVIARTRYGSARQLTGAKPTEAQKQESKRALDKIVNSKGKEYVESQRGLPDQIVIP